jgi:hypothetical protein
MLDLRESLIQVEIEVRGWMAIEIAVEAHMLYSEISYCSRQTYFMQYKQ